VTFSTRDLSARARPAQFEEVQQILKVDLPVSLGMGRQRLLRLLTSDTGRQPRS
jgi:hypothetical protein